MSFEQSIRQLLVRKEYQCNGETRKLARGIQFYWMPVAEQELVCQLQQLFKVFSITTRFFSWLYSFTSHS
ncbi:hypothetical protein [Endozoicomonas sp. GU-1]|uniref:hypothetical protein n=1 Tax=Endozoicomonas sp. GU-1 TaxID=3009078 RepID=UPI0022B31A25|nr:hypothetical protein [Endozoicomonas sp. GU-1]WBA81991.1 hypothetical protein O2T12_02145 [Endozoicomonas sp. GU-1]